MVLTLVPGSTSDGEAGASGTAVAQVSPLQGQSIRLSSTDVEGASGSASTGVLSGSMAVVGQTLRTFRRSKFSPTPHPRDSIPGRS